MALNSMPELSVTTDGSHTLYMPELDEHYHSTFGAITESKHVFIESGFRKLVQLNPISILEIGFGTGLNALMTLIESFQYKIKIVYHTIDNLPVDHNIIRSLNYAKLLSGEQSFDQAFASLHSSDWNKMVAITENFKLHKIMADFTSWVPDFRYDLIYFDAFAPDKQPEMWVEKQFRKLFGYTNPGGILVTYCAKGQVRRDLVRTGYDAELLPGPPGKRHMLRAIRKGE